MKVTKSYPGVALVAASVAAILAAPGVTRAANNTPADSDDAGNITEVIVTATRREERLLVSTSVLSGVAPGAAAK